MTQPLDAYVRIPRDNNRGLPLPLNFNKDTGQRETSACSSWSKIGVLANRAWRASILMILPQSAVWDVKCSIQIVSCEQPRLDTPCYRFWGQEYSKRGDEEGCRRKSCLCLSPLSLSKSPVITSFVQFYKWLRAMFTRAA